MKKECFGVVKNEGKIYENDNIKQFLDVSLLSNLKRDLNVVRPFSVCLDQFLSA